MCVSLLPLFLPRCLLTDPSLLRSPPSGPDVLQQDLDTHTSRPGNLRATPPSIHALPSRKTPAHLYSSPLSHPSAPHTHPRSLPSTLITSANDPPPSLPSHAHLLLPLDDPSLTALSSTHLLTTKGVHPLSPSRDLDSVSLHSRPKYLPPPYSTHPLSLATVLSPCPDPIPLLPSMPPGTLAKQRAAPAAAELPKHACPRSSRAAWVGRPPVVRLLARSSDDAKPCLSRCHAVLARSLARFPVVGHVARR